MLDSSSGLELLKYQNKGHLDSYENLKDMPSIVRNRKFAKKNSKESISQKV